MIRDNRDKLMIVLLVIIFGAGLFFGVKFLKNQISQATSTKQGDATTKLDMDSWNKIKHHFGQ